MNKLVTNMGLATSMEKDGQCCTQLEMSKTEAIMQSTHVNVSTNRHTIK